MVAQISKSVVTSPLSHISPESHLSIEEKLKKVAVYMVSLL